MTRESGYGRVGTRGRGTGGGTQGTVHGGWGTGDGTQGLGTRRAKLDPTLILKTLKSTRLDSIGKSVNVFTLDLSSDPGPDATD